MGRNARGQWDKGWTPPDYVVDDEGRVVGRWAPTEPNNWGRWGDSDQVGAANLITPERVAAAARLVQDGNVTSCALVMEQGAPAYPGRPGLVHTRTAAGTDFVAGSSLMAKLRGLQTADDFIALPVQSTTHWDGLSHIGFEDVLYNGYWIGTVEATVGARRCSIDVLAESLVGRGVLLDIPRHLGVDRLEPGFAIEPDTLESCARAQGVAITPGDMVLIRTAHLPWFFDIEDKARFWEHAEPGLSRQCDAWAHDHDIAAIAVDNVAVEANPLAGDGPAYPLHIRLVRDLGVTLGELWWLEDLAAHCSEIGRHEFFLSAAPLRLKNGSGSMVNPVAIT